MRIRVVEVREYDLPVFVEDFARRAMQQPSSDDMRSLLKDAEWHEDLVSIHIESVQEVKS